MKKFLIAAVLICAAATSFSQTDKGDFLVGGSFGFRTNKNNSSFSLLPNGGYFVARNVAVGANLIIDLTKNGNINQSDIGLGPFIRYYIGQTTVRPFLTSSIGYVSQSYKTNGIKTTTNGFNFLAGLGYAAFISNDVAIEGIAGYNYTKYKNASSYNGFSLNFGFQVYINKGKMADLKRGKIE